MRHSSAYFFMVELSGCLLHTSAQSLQRSAQAVQMASASRLGLAGREDLESCAAGGVHGEDRFRRTRGPGCTISLQVCHDGHGPVQRRGRLFVVSLINANLASASNSGPIWTAVAGANTAGWEAAHLVSSSVSAVKSRVPSINSSSCRATGRSTLTRSCRRLV